ncbi:diguanylate cyclase [Porphyromonadaceae bacterium OttesenSCG-928-L07]|nr:diguanylate cyclase [Porphyromonadaceae bacterium OttesenSCG-928-L07]
MSVSIGLVQAQRGETMDSVMQRADESLYRAKWGGRNRVVVDDE